MIQVLLSCPPERVTPGAARCAVAGQSFSGRSAASECNGMPPDPLQYFRIRRIGRWLTTARRARFGGAVQNAMAANASKSHSWARRSLCGIPRIPLVRSSGSTVDRGPRLSLRRERASSTAPTEHRRPTADPTPYGGGRLLSFVSAPPSVGAPFHGVDQHSPLTFDVKRRGVTTPLHEKGRRDDRDVRGGAALAAQLTL